VSAPCAELDLVAIETRPWLTRGEAAAMAGVSRYTIYAWMEATGVDIADNRRTLFLTRPGAKRAVNAVTFKRYLADPKHAWGRQM
jgi:hypothetical protein